MKKERLDLFLVEQGLKVLGFAREIGFVPKGLSYSPIKGPEGNIEYLLYLGKEGSDAVSDSDPQKVVTESHLFLL